MSQFFQRVIKEARRTIGVAPSSFPSSAIPNTPAITTEHSQRHLANPKTTNSRDVALSKNQPSINNTPVNDSTVTPTRKTTPSLEQSSSNKTAIPPTPSQPKPDATFSEPRTIEAHRHIESKPAKHNPSNKRSFSVRKRIISHQSDQVILNENDDLPLSSKPTDTQQSPNAETTSRYSAEKNESVISEKRPETTNEFSTIERESTPHNKEQPFHVPSTDVEHIEQQPSNVEKENVFIPQEQAADSAKHAAFPPISHQHEPKKKTGVSIGEINIEIVEPIKSPQKKPVTQSSTSSDSRRHLRSL